MLNYHHRTWVSGISEMLNKCKPRKNWILLLPSISLKLNSHTHIHFAPPVPFLPLPPAISTAQPGESPANGAPGDLIYPEASIHPLSIQSWTLHSFGAPPPDRDKEGHPLVMSSAPGPWLVLYKQYLIFQTILQNPLLTDEEIKAQKKKVYYWKHS